VPQRCSCGSRRGPVPCLALPALRCRKGLILSLSVVLVPASPLRTGTRISRSVARVNWVRSSHIRFWRLGSRACELWSTWTAPPSHFPTQWVVGPREARRYTCRVESEEGRGEDGCASRHVVKLPGQDRTGRGGLLCRIRL
jgi:hypothetical protein